MYGCFLTLTAMELEGSNDAATRLENDVCTAEQLNCTHVVVVVDTYMIWLTYREVSTVSSTKER